MTSIDRNGITPHQIRRVAEPEFPCNLGMMYKEEMLRGGLTAAPCMYARGLRSRPAQAKWRIVPRSAAESPSQR